MNVHIAFEGQSFTTALPVCGTAKDFHEASMVVKREMERHEWNCGPVALWVPVFYLYHSRTEVWVWCDEVKEWRRPDGLWGELTPWKGGV